MNENRRQILEMLATGKITADEADRLLAALEPAPAAAEFTGRIPGCNGAAPIPPSRPAPSTFASSSKPTKP